MGTTHAYHFSLLENTEQIQISREIPSLSREIFSLSLGILNKFGKTLVANRNVTEAFEICISTNFVKISS